MFFKGHQGQAEQPACELLSGHDQQGSASTSSLTTSTVVRRRIAKARRAPKAIASRTRRTTPRSQARAIARRQACSSAAAAINSALLTTSATKPGQLSRKKLAISASATAGAPLRATSHRNNRPMTGMTMPVAMMLHTRLAPAMGTHIRPSRRKISASAAGVPRGLAVSPVVMPRAPPVARWDPRLR